MFCVIYFLYIVTSPVFTAVATDRINPCAVNEFLCHDGGCVNMNYICDGVSDCPDGSNEFSCNGYLDSDNITGILNRNKRQATSCRRDQWQCRDGTCIGFDGKCDGIVDCPDGSDETHPLCRKFQCQSNWFRCTYGACVDGNAPCNNVQDCADNSDELLPRCRNESDVINGQFRCQNGQTISAAELCDGNADCADGSDETVRACAAKTCPSYLFQCAYGACVDQGSDCNGKQECADGSDESDELCNRIAPTITTAKPVVKPLPQGGKCVLPPYPAYGSYSVAGNPNALPGQSYETVYLNVTCNPGFGVEDDKDSLYCFDGIWSDNIPKCVRFCRLNKHPSVEYRCLFSGTDSVEGSRECGPQEPTGTVVRPVCRAPNYYYSGILQFMHCIDGSWDYIAICKPGGDTNITIDINDTIKIYITSNSGNKINIQINDGNNNNVKAKGSNGSNLQILQTQNSNLEIMPDGIDNSRPFDNGDTGNSRLFHNGDTGNSRPFNKDRTGNSRPFNTDHTGSSRPFDNGDTGNGKVNNSNTQTSPLGNGDQSFYTNNNIIQNTGDASAYDIDESDWRMGQVVATKPKEDKNNIDIINPKINFRNRK